jgi:hypothetical protein
MGVELGKLNFQNVDPKFSQNMFHRGHRETRLIETHNRPWELF